MILIDSALNDTRAKAHDSYTTISQSRKHRMNQRQSTGLFRVNFSIRLKNLSGEPVKLFLPHKSSIQQHTQWRRWATGLPSSRLVSRYTWTHAIEPFVSKGIPNSYLHMCSYFLQYVSDEVPRDKIETLSILSYKSINRTDNLIHNRRMPTFQSLKQQVRQFRRRQRRVRTEFTFTTDGNTEGYECRRLGTLRAPHKDMPRK